MRQPPQRRLALQALGAAAVGLIGSRAGAQSAVRNDEPLPGIEDLQKVAGQARRERLPLLLFFSTPGCPFCLEVRRNYLGPRVRQGSAAGVIVREIDITSRRTFAGLDGKPISDAELAARFNVRMVPVVVLVNRDLVPLADPLVGIDRSGFYEGYLSSAIETATNRLGKE